MEEKKIKSVKSMKKYKKDMEIDMEKIIKTLPIYTKK